MILTINIIPLCVGCYIKVIHFLREYLICRQYRNTRDISFRMHLPLSDA